MAQKLYAQEDLRLDEKKTIARGEVLCELPDGVTRDHIVSYALAGKIGEEPPKDAAEKPADAVAAAKPANARPIVPAADPATATK